MKTIKDLENIGFENVGRWFLNEQNKGIDFNIEAEFLNIDDILYAFESNGIVRYIGITEQTLRARMINYKSGHEENKSSGVTNRFVNREIKKLLLEETKVQIYILKGEADCKHYGFRISLSTGIEKSLIKSFDEDNNLWNKRGVLNKNEKASKENNKTVKVVKDGLPNNQMIFELGIEAFDKGFILFNNKVDNLLPLESEGMDIHYETKKISGWFTRSGTNKKVNGYSELKENFCNEFNFKDKILITILNPNEIRIEKY